MAKEEEQTEEKSHFIYNFMWNAKIHCSIERTFATFKVQDYYKGKDCKIFVKNVMWNTNKMKLWWKLTQAEKPTALDVVYGAAHQILSKFEYCKKEVR